MSKKMLVDASHPEEIRLVVCNKGLIEDFEYQSSLRNSLKGNVYLAKVSKVEPSLQAAFIEYGGGCQGFLPLQKYILIIIKSLQRTRKNFFNK